MTRFTRPGPHSDCREQAARLGGDLVPAEHRGRLRIAPDLIDAPPLGGEPTPASVGAPRSRAQAPAARPTPALKPAPCASSPPQNDGAGTGSAAEGDAPQRLLRASGPPEWFPPHSWSLRPPPPHARGSSA